MAYPTNPIYKLFNNLDGNLNAVLKEDQGYKITIPIDPENKDYQEYLKWVEAGNTAEAAD